MIARNIQIISMVFLALIASIGCQKAAGNKVLPPPPVENLAGNSATEVLQKKYTRAVLSCDLYVQHTAELTKSAPNDHFSVDLRGLQGAPESWILIGSADGLTVEATLSFQSLTLLSMTMDDALGNTHRVQNSPAMPLTFNVRESFGAAESESSIVATLVEKIPLAPLSLARTLAGDQVKFHEHLECTLSTDIKPSYADQFKTVKLGTKSPR